MPKIGGASSSVVFTISDGKNSREVMWDYKKRVVQVQASGEWVSLGEHFFAAGQNGFVEISSKNADGIVVADAIILVPTIR